MLWRKCGSREFIVPEVGVRGASWDRMVEDTVRMLVDLKVKIKKLKKNKLSFLAKINCCLGNKKRNYRLSRTKS